MRLCSCRAQSLVCVRRDATTVIPLNPNVRCFSFLSPPADIQPENCIFIFALKVKTKNRILQFNEALEEGGFDCSD